MGDDHHGSASSIKEQKKLGALIVLIEIFCIIIFAIAGNYQTHDLESFRYPLWQDINVMIFVGFGFLMTFLRNYSFSAVGYTFLIGGIAFQLYPIWEMIWEVAFEDHEFKMYYSTTKMMLSSFCAGAVLITYGGIIGKVSGYQLILCQVIETIAFSLNERISLHMGVADIGGSMVIHTFGAVFGIVLAKIMSPRDSFGHKKAESNYISDLTSFIGTIFLWMYWPSFNAGPAPTDSVSQTRAFSNTILSLSGSVMSTFVISLFTRDSNKKFNMIDIQNATLAGGVAMGACANMNINPIWAILIGISAGIISCLGFSKLQAFLESKIGLHDSCGIMNLHCLPGIWGSIWAAVAAAKAQDRGDTIAQLLEVYPKASESDWTQSKQGGIQVAFLFITIGIAVGSAIITGVLLRLTGSTPSRLFEDSESYHIPRIRYDDPEELLTKIPKQPQSQLLLVTEQNQNNPINTQIEVEQFNLNKP